MRGGRAVGRAGRRWRPLISQALVAFAALAAWSPDRLTAQLSVPVDTFTLPNGLQVVVHEDHSAPLVAVNVWYHVGSGREVEGRRGFAHLFEHMLFQGSEHVAKGQHLRIVQEAGGTLNGSTNTDRTNYYELVPANHLEQVLWLEADRMGFLLPALTQATLDNQRDVVKNERRQRYENAPYGMTNIALVEARFPKGHPYSWPTIGYMEDLTAASLDDVQGFFRRWYGPNNASLVVAGDVRTADVRRLVEKYFGDIPSGPKVDAPEPAAAPIPSDRRTVLEDRVTLPQLTIAWNAAPAWHADDAALDLLGRITGAGRSSRLYRRLVYADQAAQAVSATNLAARQAGTFIITVQAREGFTLSQMEDRVMEELRRLADEGPAPAELERAKTALEAQLVYGTQTLLGKADQLNAYLVGHGRADAFQEDLDRHRAVTAADVKRVARTYLTQPRVLVSVVPMGKRELAATGGTTP